MCKSAANDKLLKNPDDESFGASCPAAHSCPELIRVRAELESARAQLERQKPLISASFLQRLLMGAVPAEEWGTVREFLGLDQPGYLYNVLTICAYRNFDADLIRSAIVRFLGNLPCYFSPRERSFALILSCPAADGDGLLMRVNAQVLHLHDFLLDAYDIWLFAGLGRSTDDPALLWECYRQALEAVSYTYRNYILYPYEFLKKDTAAFYYPPELSTKLVQLITAGSTEQVAKIFEVLHRENMEKRSLPAPMVRYLLSDIRNTLVRARFALPASADAHATAALDEQFGVQVTFQLCEDLARELCQLFAAGTKKEEALAIKIENYIREHFRDPGLGLEMISEKFGISKTYFSHMFKDKIGVNFSTYLENVRMNEAVRLIREGSCASAELYRTVGYTNRTTFRRAFKKLYGVTPNEFQHSSQTV